VTPPVARVVLPIPGPPVVAFAPTRSLSPIIEASEMEIWEEGQERDEGGRQVVSDEGGPLDPLVPPLIADLGSPGSAAAASLRYSAATTAESDDFVARMRARGVEVGLGLVLEDGEC
jgi:hypothetical protein